MEITIGGNRLGSGKKMETELNHYRRSSHNLSENFLSTIAPGVLVPFYQQIALRGDTFEIDMDAAVRTLPTSGPLFGTFKLQMDYFVCPIRLYQGILHNNPINLGMNMKEVKLPLMAIPFKTDNSTKIAPNSLINYLGIKGVGHYNLADNEAVVFKTRGFSALGMLSYYDIFKNYYANKQEDKAYVIAKANIALFEIEQILPETTSLYPTTTKLYNPDEIQTIMPTALGLKNVRFITSKRPTINRPITPNDIFITLYDINNNETYSGSIAGNPFGIGIDCNEKGNVKILHQHNTWSFNIIFNGYTENWSNVYISPTSQQVELIPFELAAIDRMRERILKNCSIDDQVIIAKNTSQGDELPYITNTAIAQTGTLLTNQKTLNEDPMNGLVVKTYQSDLFNNWVKTDFITGENGIAEITKIDTTEGLTMDALNLAQKIYNMLNRVAVSGGTYQDWESAVWTDKAKRLCETPMWIGGMSDEVVFNEIVQTTPTDESPLGNLGGKGNNLGKKHGGHIKFRIDEASIIMGIVSLTPRICYSQGNEWFNTELKSIDDLHKPALDGIGFQELITEQMAAWDTELNTDEQGNLVETKKSAGFVPAWINYMTAVDKVYGDFADLNKAGYMVLNRNYEEISEGEEDIYPSRIKDLTTYIDPSKFNYAFAYDQLDAQNFWVQIRSQITTRRLMSAKIIPNL